MEARLRRIGEIAAQNGCRAWLVGGPVRDLILGRSSPDLDIAVEGPVEELASSLAEHLSGRVRKTTDFMTCTLVLPDGTELDIAHARSEYYPEPGALPVVRPAGIEEDLGRRDFTVNAMALALVPDEFGELLDPYGGIDDVKRRLLRVLHDRSFVDDPTRMLRALRFKLRLGFTIEAHTRQLLRRAAEERLLALLSGARLRNELRVIFAEAPTTALRALDDVGLLEAMGFARAHPRAIGLCALLDDATAALELAANEIHWIALCLGVHSAFTDDTPEQLGERLMLQALERADLIQVAHLVAEPPAALLADGPDSRLYFALESMTATVAAAVWTALDPAGRERLQHYWQNLRGESADITGRDLKAAGYEPGPLFTEALRAALTVKLDRGADRETQLRTALEVLAQDTSKDASRTGEQ